ncbi:MAG TPA: bifunctional DNA-formamidopyrimidine glycosylase/DNA-(apurinic or apyrimidinic site) lyase [Acidimicrobiales bacterium]|nr:bifunctional DNA-formamidopyrimidine glycosylase/DNA-(apurinic or apyrimidinic site) lyase [Acidimicrobiales bacterium]
MPELPEVETVRRGLERAVLGRRVVAVEVLGARSVRRQDAPAFRAALVGRRLVAARRRGKFLLVDLAPGRGPAEALVCHLRMSGQLLLVPPGAPRVAHTHVVLGLDDASELRFVDPRTFGELFVAPLDPASGLPAELRTLGPDPLADGLPTALLRRLLARRRTSLKAFLLDQRAVAGIGNLYADEICFAARLAPGRRTDSLSAREAARLAAAIAEVLSAAVAARGSSLRDGRYRDLGGEPGAYQDRHAVYGRAGAPCPRCARPVVRARIAGRSAHFCPACQR